MGGERLSSAYEQLVEDTAHMLKLDQTDHLALALRAYDLVQHSDLAYAKFYLDKIKEIYLKDSREYGFQATRATILYLHKVMLIKDEIYVSHLLTSEEKLKRDRDRYNIHPENGDHIVYTHINRPSFTVLGRTVEFDLRTRNWQLHIMKRLKWLRSLLPEWHKREKDFRDWYIRLVDAFDYADRSSYDRYVAALRVPEEVRGYRDIRYPKMEEAHRRVQTLLPREEPAVRQERVSPQTNSTRLNLQKQ